MKHFFLVFLCVLLSCAVLAVFAYGIVGVANILNGILSSNEASVNNTATENNPVIILDAGHGGIDGGAVSASGVKEKDLNLDVVLKMEKLLTEKGYQVLLTRRVDEQLTHEGAATKKTGDLQARVEFAEKTENALFVSIHMNRFQQSSVKGITLYYSPNHPEGRRIAEVLMAVTKEKLQPENKRPIKEAGSSIYILNRITKPAVLVECGFLSNPYEASLLASEDYRLRLADLLTEGLIRYLESLSQ